MLRDFQDMQCRHLAIRTEINMPDSVSSGCQKIPLFIWLVLRNPLLWYIWIVTWSTGYRKVQKLKLTQINCAAKGVPKNPKLQTLLYLKLELECRSPGRILSAIEFNVSWVSHLHVKPYISQWIRSKQINVSCAIIAQTACSGICWMDK